MISSRAAYVAYAVFLIAFAVFKYSSAAPETFAAEYAISVCFLVMLTGVVPFVLASQVGKRQGSTIMQWLASLGVAAVTCCLGYASYWALFIEPSGADVPVLAVALRGLIAGPIEGILAGILVTSDDA
jgi:hypothetical protein